MEKVRAMLSGLSKRSIIGFSVLVLLLLALGLSVWQAQNQTNTRSRASNEQASLDQIDILTDQLLQSAKEYEQAVQTNELISVTPSVSPTYPLTPTVQISQPDLVQGEHISKEVEEKDNKMITIAKARKDLLLQKIETNPQEFLDKATLVDKRDQLPSQIQPFVEKKVDKEGLLTLVHIDYFEEKKSEYDYILKQPDVENQPEEIPYELHFVKDPPQVLSGSQVKVNGGVEIEKQVVIANAAGTGNNSLQVISAATQTPALGEQKTAVILVNFADTNLQPVTKETVISWMFDTNNLQSVNNFYKQSTDNKVSFSGDVFGWLTIPFDKCPTEKGGSYGRWLMTIYDKAQEQGANLGNYQRRVYVFSDKHGCGLIPDGMGEIGPTTPTNSLIFKISDFKRISAHELGHNLGLSHANKINCDMRSFTGEFVYRCDDITPYGDNYDVMGQRYIKFNAPHKISAGWINPQSIQQITIPGTYNLIPLESTEPGIQILTIPTNRNLLQWAYVPQKANYYISYRQRMKASDYFDSNLPIPITEGVSIHLWLPPSTDKYVDTLIVNALGSSSASENLLDGLVYYDQVANIWIKQTSHTLAANNAGGSATVEIGFGSPPSTPTPTPIPTFDLCTVCSADVNKDGVVDLWDNDIIADACLLQPISGDCSNADADKNGRIDFVDLNCILKFFNKTCPSNIQPTPTRTPTPMPTNTPTPTPTRTPTPSPTSAPKPTATPTPAPKPKADLIVSSINIVGTPLAGRSNRFNVGIYNGGNTTVNAFERKKVVISLNIYRPNRSKLGTCSQNLSQNLPSNRAATVAVTNCRSFDIFGIHTITATVDSTKVVSESNEKNNTKSITVNVR